MKRTRNINARDVVLECRSLTRVRLESRCLGLGLELELGLETCRLGLGLGLGLDTSGLEHDFQYFFHFS